MSALFPGSLVEDGLVRPPQNLLEGRGGLVVLRLGDSALGCATPLSPSEAPFSSAARSGAESRKRANSRAAE